MHENRRDAQKQSLHHAQGDITRLDVFLKNSGWLPSPTPYRAEAKAHIQFAAQRIKCAGAGTRSQFFTIGKGDAEAYVVAIMGQHNVGPTAPILCDN